ncbi:MAG: TetR/AcrR family transcriptional regulator [Acholeplasmataceae bacterium]|nr:TetR/AcrR family transcriptional regulator [Acholeplasmataceae bacterium]
MQTKDKIIEVIIDYIKQDIDVSQISLSEIAKKADIGKSTVYEYFENKESLICDTYMFLFDYYEQEILKPLNETTFKKAFIEQVRRILNAMKDAKHLVETMMKQQSNETHFKNELIDKKINDVSIHMEERFIEIMRLGLAEGLISGAIKETKTRGYVIRALISGLSFQYINMQTDLSEEGILSLIYDEVLRVTQY